MSVDELSRIEVIKGQRKTSTLTPAVTRRAAVAAALAALEPGAWTDIDELFGILRPAPPLVATRSLLALWRLYIVDSYYGSLGHAGPPGLGHRGGQVRAVRALRVRGHHRPHRRGLRRPARRAR